jgi:hypothetical protein
VGCIPGICGIPGIPGVGCIPGICGIPGIPGVGCIPGICGIPGIPGVGCIPGIMGISGCVNHGGIKLGIPCCGNLGRAGISPSISKGISVSGMNGLWSISSGIPGILGIVFARCILLEFLCSFMPIGL